MWISQTMVRPQKPGPTYGHTPVSTARHAFPGPCTPVSLHSLSYFSHDRCPSTHIWLLLLHVFRIWVGTLSQAMGVGFDLPKAMRGRLPIAAKYRSTPELQTTQCA